jgi:glucokinase
MLVGIDVGGTKVEGVVIDRSGKIHEIIKEPTEKKKERLLNQIIDITHRLSKDRKIESIGIGFPGSIDRKKGVVINTPNLGIKNFDVQKKISRHFKVPVKIENDGNCMAVAEFLFGYGKGKNNIVSITIGTGIGGGIIIDKKLYIGQGNAGEIGHLTLIKEGKKCNCGNTGCWEEYASGRAIMRYAKEEGLKAGSPREIEEMARKGNKKAIEIYRKVGEFLGVGIGDIVKIVDPEIITLLGSIAHAHDLFLKELKKELKKRTYFPVCDVKVSKLRHTPAVGAAALFLL